MSSRDGHPQLSRKQEGVSSMNIYYVYAYLREDGTPYYIGKGKGRRAYQTHARKDGVKVNPPQKNRIVFCETGLTDIGACAIERRLIRWYGKKINGGILVNIQDGGNGGGSIGFKWSKEEKERMSIQRKGKKLGPNSIPSPLKGIERPEETKRKISEANKGRVFGCSKKKSEAARKRSAEGRHPWKGKKRPTKICPHCNKEGADYLMSRWHFDNCSQLDTLTF
jgi:hypothetical protein